MPISFNFLVHLKWAILSTALLLFVTINASSLQQDFKKPVFNFSELHWQTSQQPEMAWAQKSLREKLGGRELWRQDQECRVKQHRKEKYMLQNAIQAEHRHSREQGKKIKHLGKQRKRVRLALNDIIVRVRAEKEQLRVEKERLELENKELKNQNRALVRDINRILSQPDIIAPYSIVSNRLPRDSIAFDSIVFDSGARELIISECDNAAHIDDGPPGWR